jgi:signal transduction histidine kinase
LPLTSTEKSQAARSVPGSSEDQRLAAWARLLMRLQGALGHELRSPLGGMLINLESLGHSAGELPAEARRSIEAMRGEVPRVRQGLRALLSLLDSRSERGGFDLTAAAREVAGWVEGLARAGRCVVEVVRPTPGLHVEEGRDDTLQALLHLVLRALDVAGPEGVVTLEPSRDPGPPGRAVLRIGVSGTRPGGALDQVSEDVAMARALIEGRGGRLEIEAGNVGPQWRIELPCRVTV